jgi:uncharacterized protein (DUF1499 family)
MKRRPMLKLLLAAGAALLMLRCFGALAGRSKAQGIVDGGLAPCPGSPNCVCTFDRDPQHAIAPIKFEGSAAEAIERLRNIVLQQPRSRIVKIRENYLRAEFTSLMLGFVDDVEFLIDAEKGQIHFRSASRLGRRDFGVNRGRMEAIRQAWQSSAGN